MEFLNPLGAVIMVVLGLAALLFPAAIGRFVSVAPVGKEGTSELRATYGGFFLLLGLGCLYLALEPVYQAAGAAWIGAALARLGSAFVDRSASVKNLGGVVFEAFIGALLLA